MSASGVRGGTGGVGRVGGGGMGCPVLPPHIASRRIGDGTAGGAFVGAVPIMVDFGTGGTGPVGALFDCGPSFALGLGGRRLPSRA